MQSPNCDYGDSAKSLSSAAGKARLCAEGVLEKRWGEQEGRKKDGDRDVQDMKEVPDSPVHVKHSLLF